MRQTRRSLFAAGAAAAAAGTLPSTPVQAQAPAPAPTQAATGNVIFCHPDGAGLNVWNAIRMVTVGPDGRTNWDRLPATAIYLGHMKDALTGTSHGGATTHAYGVKVQADSFGQDGNTPIAGASGFQGSIAQEAMARGKAVGLVQTGAAYEPGTAAFVASTARRNSLEEITRLVAESGVPVHLAGGERWYLPRGTQGRFGEGARTDGRNLVEELRAKGYTLVFTKEELAALPPTATRVWGIFAHDHTFNDRNEETLAQQNLPLYVETAPSFAEMVQAALAILSRAPGGFLLVAEEEGTDNFGNVNNARGMLEAGKRADAAIGVIAEFIGRNPNTLMLTTADSDAGALQVLGPRAGSGGVTPGQPLAERDRNGAPLDGESGTRGVPFIAAPDRNGQRLPFAVAWASVSDASGAMLVRGIGLNSGQITGVMDNSEIYRVMHRTLFGAA
ncbi:alkaline phosphatase [Falsiroseomonas oryziterrae]|uniref:alkaline phosphatase n=1 Tax=Falsiroseomonas oryziterrae TaxID=2911368 RepID=UPI001F02AA21|nr:alkaline phosphatase [Roseomonas sp. NPKOSM-4]